MSRHQPDLRAIDHLKGVYAVSAKSIRDRVEAYALAQWGAGEYRDADMVRFLNRVVPVIKAGGTQMSALTDSYLARALTLMTGTPTRARGAIDTATLRGVPADEVYKRPFQTVWTKLSEQRPLDAAVGAGKARLVDIVRTDMQLAKTRTSQSVLSRDDRVRGFSRDVTGVKTCALCYVASTQIYSRGDLMPIHPGCSCGISPVTNSSPFDSQAASDRLESVHNAVNNELGVSDRGGRAPDYRKLVVTREHGEYGPTLVQASQRFTGPRDL